MPISKDELRQRMAVRRAERAELHTTAVALCDEGMGRHGEVSRDYCVKMSRVLVCSICNTGAAVDDLLEWDAKL